MWTTTTTDIQTDCFTPCTCTWGNYCSNTWKDVKCFENLVLSVYYHYCIMLLYSTWKHRNGLMSNVLKIWFYSDVLDHHSFFHCGSLLGLSWVCMLYNPYVDSYSNILTTIYSVFCSTYMIVIIFVYIGASTAMLGNETAMTCTVAVEDVIEQHYNR